jgi:hypothetical protein
MPEAIEKRLGNLSASIQEAVVAQVSEQLETLEGQVSQIPSPTPPPRTTLQIQELAGAEKAWQKYLRYFLDPSADHGLETDALNRFLEGLNGHVGGNFPDRVPSHVSDNVEVVTERRSDAGNQPDLIIRVPGWFFICFELKLYSPERKNQTRRYVEDDQIGQARKEEFPEQGHHYVYIRRPGNDRASDDQFANVTWKQVKDWLAPLLHGSRGRYPMRTTAQLNDFLDTIHLDMTDDPHLQTKREKMKLYFKHLDAIEEARDGLDTVYEHAKENWRRYFLDGHLPDTWTEDWHCNPGEYGQIYHSKWRQKDGLNLPDGWVRMHFVHLIRKPESFEDGKLTMELRWSGNQNRYKDRFKELFTSDRFDGELDPALGEHNIDRAPKVNINVPQFTRKEYSVSRSNLPESYYETLSRAVKEHQQLAPAINKILETAIREVDAETKDSTSAEQT